MKRFVSVICVCNLCYTGDGVVSQVEFLARLVPEYSDDLTATYLFGSLDSDGDGVLSEVDIDEMYADIDKDSKY